MRGPGGRTWKGGLGVKTLKLLRMVHTLGLLSALYLDGAITAPHTLGTPRKAAMTPITVCTSRHVQQSRAGTNPLEQTNNNIINSRNKNNRNKSYKTSINNMHYQPSKRTINKLGYKPPVNNLHYQPSKRTINSCRSRGKAPTLNTGMSVSALLYSNSRLSGFRSR